MSDADVLREAVRALRDQWGSPMGAAWHQERDFHLAVADWIDSHAGDLASAYGHLPSCDSPGDVEQALAVARAYLGRDQ